MTPWPPYRIPTPVHSAFEDPCKLLGSRLFHATAFVILYKSVFNQNVTDNSVALLIHLLDLAVIYADPHPNTQVYYPIQINRIYLYIIQFFHNMFLFLLTNRKIANTYSFDFLVFTGNTYFEIP